MVHHLLVVVKGLGMEVGILLEGPRLRERKDGFNQIFHVGVGWQMIPEVCSKESGKVRDNPSLW